MKSMEYPGSLSYEIENYVNISGYRIFYRIIGSGSSDRAILFLHDRGSHCGYLQNITNEELVSNLDFYAFDLPGFGSSSGKRGHIDSFESYIDLLDKFITNKIERAGVKELYLVGEGMGSLLGFYYSRNRGSALVKGLIFLPGLFYIEELKRPLLRGTLGLLNIVTPELMTGRSCSIRLLSELKRYLKYMRREIENSPVPILIFQGKDDLYQGVTECIEVFTRVSSSEENRIVILENSSRSLLLDHDLAEIRAVLQSWIE